MPSQLQKNIEELCLTCFVEPILFKSNLWIITSEYLHIFPSVYVFWAQNYCFYRRCPSCQIPPSVVHLSPLLLYSPRSVNNILEKCSTCMQTDYMLKRVGGLVHQQHSVVAFQIVIEATLLSSASAFSLGLPSYKINQFQDYAGCSTMGFIQLFCQNRSNLMQVFLVDFR